MDCGTNSRCKKKTKIQTAIEIPDKSNSGRKRLYKLCKGTSSELFSYDEVGTHNNIFKADKPVKPVCGLKPFNFNLSRISTLSIQVWERKTL